MKRLMNMLEGEETSTLIPKIDEEDEEDDDEDDEENEDGSDDDDSSDGDDSSDDDDSSDNDSSDDSFHGGSGGVVAYLVTDADDPTNQFFVPASALPGANRS